MSHAHDSTRLRGLLYVAKSQQSCRLTRPVSSHHMLMHDASLQMICLVSTPLLSLSQPKDVTKNISLSATATFFHTWTKSVSRDHPGALAIKSFKTGERKLQGWDPTLRSHKKSSRETHVNDQKETPWASTGPPNQANFEISS